MSLDLTDVTLTYPDGSDRLTALAGVTLRVPPGSLTAVVGPSGSGKSSLLAVAATLIRPDSGTVQVGGTDTTGLGRAQLAALRRGTIGVVFQQANLLPALTAAEQLEVMAHLGGGWSDRVRRAAARDRARELLAEVGLADLANRRPHQLSGGQQQRVGIARALMNEPSVLLVDEPTSALDRERGTAVVELITRITHQRVTATVLVTHDEEQLSAADQVVTLRDGRIVGAKGRSTVPVTAGPGVAGTRTPTAAASDGRDV